MSGNTYIKEEIKGVDLQLAKYGQQIFKTAGLLINMGY